jgi:hypothetical protein
MKKYLIIFTFFMYDFDVVKINGLKDFTKIYVKDLDILHKTVQELSNKQYDIYCLFESCYLEQMKLNISEASEINSPFGKYVISKVDGVDRLN